jgi:hypothetical protein
MPQTPEPETIEDQTAKPVDPAAICSALNDVIGEERWKWQMEELRPEAHALFSKTIVNFRSKYLGVTVNWWPDIQSIRVWAVNPTFFPGIDKTNWEESTHCHRLNDTFDISAALRVINDYSLPNGKDTMSDTYKDHGHPPGWENEHDPRCQACAESELASASCSVVDRVTAMAWDKLAIHEAIEATHPCRMETPESYAADALAMELIHKRHDKREIVNLIRWCLMGCPPNVQAHSQKGRERGPDNTQD